MRRDILECTCVIVFILFIGFLLCYLPDEPQPMPVKKEPHVQKLWQPPNSWEPGDGHPPGYDGIDLSKWRKPI